MNLVLEVIAVSVRHCAPLFSCICLTPSLERIARRPIESCLFFNHLEAHRPEQRLCVVLGGGLLSPGRTRVSTGNIHCR